MPLSEPDEKKGVVFYSSKEEIVISRIVLGTGVGEVWHTHQSSAEGFMYIVRGTMALSWEEGGATGRSDVGPGDFLHIAAGARQQWINEGQEDVEIVCISHSHAGLGDKTL